MQTKDDAPVEAGLAERLEKKADYTDRRFNNSSLGALFREAKLAIQSQSAEIARLLTADRENSELLEAAIEGQSYWQARAERAEGAIEKVRDGYKSQMKFCDIEALGYFREFVRRLDAALADAQQTQKQEEVRDAG